MVRTSLWLEFVLGPYVFGISLEKFHVARDQQPGLGSPYAGDLGSCRLQSKTGLLFRNFN